MKGMESLDRMRQEVERKCLSLISTEIARCYSVRNECSTRPFEEPMSRLLQILVRGSTSHVCRVRTSRLRSRCSRVLFWLLVWRSLVSSRSRH